MAGESIPDIPTGVLPAGRSGVSCPPASANPNDYGVNVHYPAQERSIFWYINEKIRSWRLFFNLIFAVLIGICAGFGAIGFRIMIYFMESLFFGKAHYELDFLTELSWFERILIPAAGAVIVGPLIHFFAREAKGHGVPEVMESIVLQEGIIPPKTAVTRSVASAISIGSGGSVGPEGPIVQIGSSIGSTIGQIFRVAPTRLRTFVGCGAAAGIAATFNAPIAGALFALEIIMKDFAVVRFAPVILSSILGAYVSRSFWGNIPDFNLPAFAIHGAWDLPLFAVLGVSGGLVSILYMRAIHAAEEGVSRIPLHNAVRPLIGGVSVGIIALGFPHVYGIGHDVMMKAMAGEIVWYTLAALIFLKIAATALTIGSGGSGGVFTPSLFIGAVLGGAFGFLVNALFPGVIAEPGAYAVAAMGALVAGSTHAPLTAIILTTEITNNYTNILPIMITCTISLVVAKSLQDESIYTFKLIRKGIDFFRHREINLLRSHKVREVMNSEIELVTGDTPLQALLAQVTESTHSSFFVWDENQRLRGVITVQDLRLMFLEQEPLTPLVIAQDIADTDVPALTPDDTLDVAMDFFGRKNLDELPVVSHEDRTKIIGTIRQQDVIEAYNREIYEHDILDGMAGRLEELDRLRKIEFSDGFTMTEIRAPLKFRGKSLKELNLRAQYGVEVLLVKRLPAVPSDSAHPRMMRFIPDAAYRVEAGDTFLVVGESSKIANLTLN